MGNWVMYTGWMGGEARVGLDYRYTCMDRKCTQIVNIIDKQHVNNEGGVFSDKVVFGRDGGLLDICDIFWYIDIHIMQKPIIQSYVSKNG